MGIAGLVKKQFNLASKQRTSGNNRAFSIRYDREEDLQSFPF